MLFLRHVLRFLCRRFLQVKGLEVVSNALVVRLMAGSGSLTSTLSYLMQLTSKLISAKFSHVKKLGGGWR